MTKGNQNPMPYAMVSVVACVSVALALLVGSPQQAFGANPQQYYSVVKAYRNSIQLYAGRPGQLAVQIPQKQAVVPEVKWFPVNPSEGKDVNVTVCIFSNEAKSNNDVSCGSIAKGQSLIPKVGTFGGSTQMRVELKSTQKINVNVDTLFRSALTPEMENNLMAYQNEDTEVGSKLAAASPTASTPSTTVPPSATASTTSTSVAPSATASTTSTSVAPSATGSTASTSVAPSATASSTNTAVAPSGNATSPTAAPEVSPSSMSSTVAPAASASAASTTAAPMVSSSPSSANPTPSNTPSETPSSSANVTSTPTSTVSMPPSPSKSVNASVSATPSNSKTPSNTPSNTASPSMPRSPTSTAMTNAPTPSITPTHKGGKHGGSNSNDHTTAEIAGGVGGGIGAILLIGLGIWCCKRRKSSEDQYLLHEGQA